MPPSPSLARSSIDAAALLDALPAPAALFDPTGRLMAANYQATLCFDRQASELEGLTYEEWSALVASNFVLPRGEEQGGLPAAGVEWAQRLEAPAGSSQVYQRLSRPVKVDGEVVGRLEIFRNITELESCSRERALLEARHAAELSDLQRRLDEVERIKLELTANVSHDLRTPLAGIKASVSGLLAGDVPLDAATIRETLVLIEEETDRLQRRVQNLLSMSRLEAGGAALQRDWVDAADVAASAIESLRSLIGEQQVLLEFEDDLPLVLADYDQLRIAIRNLLENALLYGPADRPVEVHLSASLGQLRVRVRDYGVGLMPDEFEQIFDKFYRGRSARQIPGTGLGLPICRGIVEGHGGRLWAEHVPGGGVAFVISLPLPPDEQGPVLPAGAPLLEPPENPQ